MIIYQKTGKDTFVIMCNIGIMNESKSINRRKDGSCTGSGKQRFP